MKPSEEISLEMWTKIPGIKNDLNKTTLLLPYDDVGKGSIRGAYSKVFHDAIIGDQTLFKNEDEIYAGWKFTDKVLEKMKDTEMKYYKIGETPSLTNN